MVGAVVPTVITIWVFNMKLVQSPDRLLLQLQSNVRVVLEPIAANPIVQGHLIPNVVLKAGMTNIIPVGLNNPVTGWFTTRLSANSVIWDNQIANNTPSQNLWLLCSVDCTISLYVF